MQRLRAISLFVLLGVMAASAQPATGDRASFKPAATPDRAGVPYAEREDPDKGGGESIVDAVWMSLVWWEMEKVLAPPDGGNTKGRSDEILRKLEPMIVKDGVETDLARADEGIQAFFAAEFKDLAVCRTFRDRQPTPAGLARYPKGADLVFLLLDRRTEKEELPPVCLTLESMTPAGAFSLTGFGHHITGQMKMLPDGSAEFMPGSRRLLSPKSRPEEVKFILRPGNVLVVRPYIFATPGKSSPPPADESFDFSETPPAVLTGGPYVERDIPAAIFTFKSPLPPPMSWTLADGRAVRAIPVGRKDDKLQFRNEAGRQVEIPESGLSPGDRARFFFWEGSNGVAQVERLDLTYRLGILDKEGVEIRITTDGTKGRVDVPHAKTSLIYDLRDGAFATLDAARSLISYRGRLAPDKLLCGEMPLVGFPEKDMDRFFRRDLPQAEASRTIAFPSRSIIFSPVANIEIRTFHKPSIDFIRCESTTALAGMFCLLHPPSADSRIVFYPEGDRMGTLDCEGAFKLLMVARALPLALRWTNNGSPDVWSLRLVKASVPIGFEADHFAIPPVAREMAVGTWN